MPEDDFPKALQALYDGGVKFIVVGGMAAALNGASVTCIRR
jgi:hypothetical protein